MLKVNQIALMTGTAVIVAMSTPVVAQEAASDEEQSAQNAGSPPQSNDIIVTANKRSESLQDVPKSVQVVSDQALQRQNVVNIGDLQKLVPTISGQGQTLAIRGVGTSAASVNAPNKVGIVLDDIPQPSSTTLSNFLLDVERIEVLPGPQGTLAGRNATGGLVNMVTRGPSDEWTGFANLLYTSDHQRQAAFFVAGPVNDKIQISTSQYFDGFRGLAKNIRLDKWSSSYTYGTRNKVRLLPTDNFTVDLTAFYQYSRQNGDTAIAPYAYVPNGFAFPSDIKRRPFSELQPGVTPSSSNRYFASERNGTVRTTDYGGIARFTYETDGGLTFTSINSYLKEVLDRDQDFNIGLIPLNDLLTRPDYDGFTHVNRTVISKTSEFRINSPSQGSLHYVAGIYYSDENAADDFQRLIFPSVAFSEFSTKSISGYAHADYDITQDLKIQGGIRFERDKVAYASVVPALLATQKLTSDGVVRNIPTGQVASSSSNSDSDNFVNFDVGMQYRVAPDFMIYGTFAKAKQGPIFDSSDNQGLTNGQIQTLPQESVKSFEFGFKSQLFDRRLTLNASFFNSEYNNYQVQTSVSIDPSLPPQRKLASVGKVRTRGVEVTASARFLDNLRSDLSLAYTQAKILDFPNAPCYINAVRNTDACFIGNPTAPVAGQFYTQGNLGGTILNRAPKIRATLTFDYSIPINDAGLDFFIAPLIKYASSQHTDLLRYPTSFVGATTYVDLNIGVRSSKVTAEVFVRNLFDENKQTYVPQQTFTPAGALQRVIDRLNDRYVGARVRYNF